MSNIKDLTEEQKAFIPVVKEEWLDKVFKNQLYKNMTDEIIIQRGKELYAFCDLAEPDVKVVSSPDQVQIYANIFTTPELMSKQIEIEYYQTGCKWQSLVDRYLPYETMTQEDFDNTWKRISSSENQDYKVLQAELDKEIQNRINNKKMEYHTFSSYVNYSDFGWLAFYDFYAKHTDVLDDQKEDLNKIISFVEASFMSVQFDKLLIVSRYPSSIHKEGDDMHHTSKPAVEFEDGFGLYYVNGRNVEEHIFKAAQNVETAKKAFMENDNEDIRALIITIIKSNMGNEGLLQMLDAYVVDEQTITHSNGYIEQVRLLKSKQSHSFLMNSKGELNQPYAWIEMKCPSTGATYLIDTCPTHTDAKECMKWHRPDGVPAELAYSWMSAN